MKKLGMLLMMLIMGMSVCMGQGIIVHRKDGKVIKIKMENVDSISFTMDKSMKEAYVFDTLNIVIVDTMIIENGDTIMKERPCYAFYGATDVFPNTPEIIMGDKHAVISNTGQTLTMATNKKSDYFLFTAIPSDKYDVSSWTDALGTNIFKNFSDPEFTSQVVINVKLSSDKYDLDAVNYKVYILGYDGDPLCETVNKSTIYKIK